MNDVDPKKLPGIKEAELLDLGACAVCKKPLISEGVTFYRLTITRAMFAPDAIRRRVGLGTMIGSQALARVMGPDEDLAKIFHGPITVAVHENCALQGTHPLDLMQKGENTDE